jgi:hypothetical protein
MHCVFKLFKAGSLKRPVSKWNTSMKRLIFMRGVVAVCLLCVSLLLPSCKVNYSMTGASISPDVKLLPSTIFRKPLPWARLRWAGLYRSAEIKVHIANQSFSS